MTASKILLAIAFLFGFTGLCQSASAETYRWTDEAGVMHFSDRPPPVSAAGETGESRRGVGAEGKKAPPQKNRYDIREKVVNIIGMDKILLESGKVVKYIGVRDPGDFLKDNRLEGKLVESEAFHRHLVMGKTVTVLLGRKSRNSKNHYLGHVFLGQDAFVNAELIRKGHAILEEFPSDYEYQSLFIRLQKEAQKSGLGLWHF